MISSASGASGPARPSSTAPVVFGFLSALIRKSSLEPCGSLTAALTTPPAKISRINNSSSFVSCADPITPTRPASTSRSLAAIVSIACSQLAPSTGPRTFVSRRSSTHLNPYRPSSQIHHSFTSALYRGLIRTTRAPSFKCGRFTTECKSILHPWLQPLHTVGLLDRYHTRTLNLESRSVSAPTGQISTTFAEYALFSVSPGHSPSSARSPRLKIPNSPVFVISSVNRTHREHNMHRS